MVENSTATKTDNTETTINVEQVAAIHNSELKNKTLVDDLASKLSALPANSND